MQKDDVTYYLFNSESYNVQLNNNNLDLIDVSLPINFLVHGWSGDSNDSWIYELVDLYLENGDVNVITVDWSGPAGDFYPTSVKEVKEIGKYFGEFIINIYENCGGNLSDVHIIGHALGAHVAAFAGKDVQKETEMSVGRITGLDVALPLFVFVDKDNRFSKGDAEVVVAIHTDGGVAGFLEAIGDVDFYPNGGVPPQPGCHDITSEYKELGKLFTFSFFF